jgi:valyl-tRNA synthetase
LDAELLKPDDKHILVRLNEAIASCDDNLEKYRFNDAAHVLYEFVRHQFCDLYVEYAKETLNGDNEARRTQVLRIMHYCFSSAVRLLHPMMPFVTEELWHAMGYAATCETIMRAPWPKKLSDGIMDSAKISADVVAYVDAKHDMVRVGRLLRADYGIAPGKRIDYMIRPNTPELAELLVADTGAVKIALRCENLTIDIDLKTEKAVPSAMSQLGTVYLPVEDVIDVEAELKRLNDELLKINGFISNATKKLSNERFVNNAPEDVVAQVRETKVGLLAKADKIKGMMESLKG